MIKKILFLLSFLSLPIWAAPGSNTSLTVSSGTFLAIDGYTNATNNFRQAVNIGDSSNTYTLRVDVSSSAYTNIQEVGGSVISLNGDGGIPSHISGGSIGNTGFNVNNLPAVTTVTFNGSAQPVSQSGNWSTRTQDGSGTSITSTGSALDINIKSGSIANTGFNVNNLPAVTTVTFNGSAQPVSQSGTWTVQPGNTANTTAWLVQTSSTGVNASTMSITAAPGSNFAQETGGNLATLSGGVSGGFYQANIAQIGGLNVIADACQSVTKKIAVINLTANTKIISGTTLKKTFICSLNLVVGAATNVALVEGTGSTCGTNTNGLAGGSTAGTGWNLAANGGLTLGNGSGTVLKADAATADDVCIFVSAANQVSGTIIYVQQNSSFD